MNRHDNPGYSSIETQINQSSIQNETPSIPSERRQPSHELDILVPSGDLPMVDSKDIEDFFTGIENEFNQREAEFINPMTSDPLLSSAGVQAALTANPHSNRAPPPPYPGTAHAFANAYPNTREIHDASTWQNPERQNHYQQTRPPVENSSLYQASSYQDCPPPGQGSNKNGQRLEPDFEHVLEDDVHPRRPRPESPRVDGQKQQLKWQEDEKLGAMATISPVLYANLECSNLRAEYPSTLLLFFSIVNIIVRPYSS